MKFLVTILFIFSSAGCVIYDLKSERDKIPSNQKSDISQASENIKNLEEKKIPTQLLINPFYVNNKNIIKEDADKDLIDKPRLSRFSDFKKCYQDESQKNNSLNGRVVVFFLINDQGKVKSSKIISTTLNNKDVEDCLIKTLNAMTFKPTPLGTIAEITYPFVFVSSELDENK